MYTNNVNINNNNIYEGGDNMKKKTVRCDFMLTEEEKALLDQIAEIYDLNKSKTIVKMINDVAKRRGLIKKNNN